MAIRIDDRTRPLYRRFLEHTAQTKLATELTQKFYATLGQQAEPAAETFMERGWTGEQIRALIRGNPAWRNDVDEVFAREEIMAGCGIPTHMARLVLKSRVLFGEFDLTTIGLAYASLKECGCTERDLGYAISEFPRALLQSPGYIADLFGESVQHAWSTRCLIRHLARGPNAAYRKHNGHKRMEKASDKTDGTITSWKVWCKMVLSSVGWDVESDWPAYVATHPWLHRRRCAETAALEQLLTWISFIPGTTGTDDRVLFFASLLLDMDLPYVKRRALQAIEESENPQDEPGVMETIAWFVRNGQKRPDTKFSAILGLAEEVIFIRLHVLRRILGLEPEQWPEMLLTPWEDVRYVQPRFPGQKFPKIPSEDKVGPEERERILRIVQIWFEEIKREMHFRVNQARIQHLGRLSTKKIRRCVFLLSRPERQEFLELLGQHGL